MARALELVDVDGLVVTFGNSSGAPTCFGAEGSYYSEAALRGFYLWRELERRSPARDLARLAAMLENGRLRVDVAQVARWERVGDVLEQLDDRRVAGKAVLLIGADR